VVICRRRLAQVGNALAEREQNLRAMTLHERKLQTMKKLVPILTAIVVLMVILACGFGSKPTETPEPVKPAATKAPAPKATNTPKPTNTATPAPTPTGPPEVNFAVDRTQIKQGECVTFSWKVENVKAVYYYQEGERWEDHGVAGQGSQQECPPSTTAFYLRVVKPDENIDLRQIAIAVELTPTATSAFDPLGGTRWRVLTYTDPASPGSLITVLTGTTMTVDFARDGQVSGSAGCNTYTSGYVVQGSLLALTPPTASNKMCTEPQGIMEQEKAFLDLLPTIGSYAMSGSQLTFKNASGVTVAELVAY
jgi:hypothetical protein